MRTGHHRGGNCKGRHSPPVAPRRSPGSFSRAGASRHGCRGHSRCPCPSLAGKVHLILCGERMWWLSFRDGSVAIVDASSLVHARLLAAANGLGRASQFVEGIFVDTARLPIPREFVGRMLSPIEAHQLGEMLSRKLRDHSAERTRRSKPPPES